MLPLEILVGMIWLRDNTLVSCFLIGELFIGPLTRYELVLGLTTAFEVGGRMIEGEIKGVST